MCCLLCLRILLTKSSLFLLAIISLVMFISYKGVRNEMVLYSDNNLRVLVSADDSFRESDFQTVPDSSEETLVEESEQTSEETSSELEYSDVSSSESGVRSETNSEGNSETSQTEDSGTETSQTVELLTHIDKTSNSFLGLFVICLVLLGIGLIIRFIWGLLNK